MTQWRCTQEELVIRLRRRGGGAAALARRILAPSGACRRKTVEAYERDVRQFLGFLTEHTGKTVDA